jgi:hypothetical protein
LAGPLTEELLEWLRLILLVYYKINNASAVFWRDLASGRAADRNAYGANGTAMSTIEFLN